MTNQSQLINKKKILVVDDKEINRSILKHLLDDDYTVVEAANGQEALDVLNSGKDNISLILLDIVMPIMDGFTFLRTIKEDSHISHIPVIVVTQQDGKESELAALDAGATDFITKPYKPDIIKFRVNSLIRFYEAVALTSAIERDKTTDVYTREAFFTYAKKSLELSNSNDWSVLCLTITNLNQIADLLGDSIGNAFLHDMCAKLITLTEPYGCILGRVWNNSILITLPGKNLDPFQNEKADFSDFIKNYPISIKINIQAGFCHMDDPTVSIRTYCDNARLAVESIEDSYYSQIAEYDAVLDSKLTFNNKLTQEAEKALKNGQFKVFYQPKVELSTGNMISAEALIRWVHPEEGMLSPIKFIPLFEHNGFITEVDLYVFEKTCSSLKKWLDAGYPTISISVNISRTDLLTGSLPDRLLAIVNKYDLDTKLLHLEITETSFVAEAEQIYETISKLRSIGFIIEMDDFGSGYSSLAMLNNAPIDIIKLDIQFLKNRRENKTDDRIFPLMARLSNDLNLPVIVEGVETLDDIDYLTSHAFKYGQGYYYSKPVPEKDFEKILKNAAINQEMSFEKCSHQTSFDDLYNFINGLPFGIMFCSENNVIEFVNEPFLEFLGVNNKYAMLPDLLTVESKNALTNLQNRCYTLDLKSNTAIPLELKSPISKTKRILIYVRKVLINGATHWQMTTLNKMTTSSDADNLDELNAIINKMKAEANYDRLTHVYNRHYFEKLVNKELASAKGSCAFIYLDIDNFKEINDTAGHQKGDAILDEFGNLLVSEFRNKDISARMGGDEFAVFVKDVPNPAMVEKRMHKICSELNEVMGITCSVGIALYPSHGKTFKELYKSADKTMYDIKTAGKNSCKICD